jgi:hypothetical protein
LLDARCRSGNELDQSVKIARVYFIALHNFQSTDADGAYSGANRPPIPGHKNQPRAVPLRGDKGLSHSTFALQYHLDPSLGDDLQDARDELGRLRTLNKGRYDWEKQKQEREKAKIKAMTLLTWLDRFLDLVKNTPSYWTRKAQCAHLKRLLGHLPLSEVSKVRILEYKNSRLSECLMRHGKPIEGKRVKGATVNREVSCLITALNLAAEEGLREEAPRIKKEVETARETTLSEGEYKSLLDVSPRWLQRVIIAANEAGLDRGVLVALTWPSVKDGLIKVQGGRTKTRARQRIGISPGTQEGPGRASRRTAAGPKHRPKGIHQRRQANQWAHPASCL